MKYLISVAAALTVIFGNSTTVELYIITFFLLSKLIKIVKNIKTEQINFSVTKVSALVGFELSDKFSLGSHT